MQTARSYDLETLIAAFLAGSALTALALALLYRRSWTWLEEMTTACTVERDRLRALVGEHRLEELDARHRTTYAPPASG